MIEKEIKNVAVIGAGKMGGGIGVDFARFGYNIILHDPYDEALKYAMERIREDLDLMVGTELMTVDEANDSYSRISTTNDLSDAVRNIDHVVEAAPEDLVLKQNLFQELDELCPSYVTLATNSSTKRVEDCALKAKNYPERILITHYWHPAPFIPMVEVIGGKMTEPWVLTRVAKLLRSMRKKVILQELEHSTGPAGWGNALQQPMEAVARKLVNEFGCKPHLLDDLISFGIGRRFHLGAIFKRYDMVGLDYYYNAAKSRGEEVWAPIKERVEKGDVGVKSGKGFYDWPGDSAKEFNRQYNLDLIAMMKQDMERGDI